MTSARQKARNALFSAALTCPQPNNYPTHAAYVEAFDAYQASTMRPLREALATTPMGVTK
jgi:hypothetical protein